MTDSTLSKQLFQEAKSILVGGVDSPARALKGVDHEPLFIHSGEGAYLYSEDGKRYIDYMLSFGPLIMGHAHPKVVKTIREVAGLGTSFGAPSVLETQLATLIHDFFPSMQKCRFVNSGTEATMSALRVAKGFTKRDVIVKFSGCYHGHSDTLLVEAGSGGLTYGKPNSAGVPENLVKDTRILDFNDVQQLEALFEKEGDAIAAVIVEPVCGNMGVILPQEGYLETMRSLCDQYGSVLIFDEVMTGFRAALNGVQGLFNITPDLTCLGKVMGGGLPCAVYGGREDIMACLAPDGAVYQAGTFSGNPLSMAAGITTLRILKETDAFDIAQQRTQELVDGLRQLLKKLNLNYTVNHCGTMFTLFCTSNPILSLNDVLSVNTELFNQIFAKMIQNGVYLAPSQFEACFMSSVHTQQDIQFTLKAFEEALISLTQDQVVNV